MEHGSLLLYTSMSRWYAHNTIWTKIQICMLDIPQRLGLVFGMAAKGRPLFFFSSFFSSFLFHLYAWKEPWGFNGIYAERSPPMMPLPGTGGNVYEPTMTTGNRTVPTPVLLSGSGSPSRNLQRICCALKAFQMRFLHYTICDMWNNFSDKTFNITNKITCFEPINWFI